MDTIQEALSQNASKTDAENNQFEKDAEVQTDGKLVLSDEELELYLIANLMLLFLAGQKRKGKVRK